MTERNGLGDVEFIYFDLDGTLFDHPAAERRALLILAEEEGLDAEPFAAAYTEVNHALWREIEQGLIDLAALRRRRIEEPLQRLGVTRSADDIARIGLRYLDIYLAADHPIEGVEVCGPLRERFGVGILTNGFRETQHLKIAGLGFDEGFFDPVICSCDLDVMKPHPAIFEHAQGLAGVEPSKIAMIGDNPSTDIAGAAAAGWRTVWMRPPGAEGREVAEADATIDRLDELPALFGVE